MDFKLNCLGVKYLCILPATVESELVSTAGQICDTKRNCLDPERLKILILKTNK